MALNYIKNGSPVEVKHIDYGTSVGYTKVGSPTISNGVVSGFSSSDYLSIADSSIALANISVRVRFTVGVLNRTQRIIFQIGNSGSSLPIGFRIHSNNKLVCYHAGTNASQRYDFADTVLEEGKTYDVEFGAINSVRYFKCGLADNMTTQTVASGSDADFEGSVTRPIYYGFAGNASATDYFDGSIDLNHTYIKVNGKLLFFRPSTNYLIKDGKLVWADSGLYLKGQHTYSVVGSPTIADNVVGNFSDTNYVTSVFPTTLPTKTECIIKFTTGDTITGTSNQSILNFVDFMNLEINTTGQLYTYDYTSKQRVGTTALAVNTTYSCHIVFENGHKNFAISTNGQGYTTMADFNDNTAVSYSRSIYFGKHPSNTNRFFKGTIDFKETYIRTDEVLYFFGKNYGNTNLAPVPGGFTYGNTTTPGAGFVNIITQAFSPSISDANVGRDE